MILFTGTINFISSTFKGKITHLFKFSFNPETFEHLDVTNKVPSFFIVFLKCGIFWKLLNFKLFIKFLNSLECLLLNKIVKIK